MIIEQRTYTLKPGSAPKLMKLYEEKGLAVQTEILGNLIGWFVVDIGPLNRIVHMWGYEDHADRDRRRAQLQADERWHAYTAESREHILEQQNVILKPAPYSPIG